MTEQKNRERALKAWETMRERGFHKYKDRSDDEMYNNPKKNKVRNKIVNLIKKHGGKNILTLETHNYMLPKLLRKNKFFIAEQDKEEYISMLKEKPDNVFLHYGNISEMAGMMNDFEVIYLDFCCGYNAATNIITELKDKIFKSKLVGFSFSLRGNKKDVLDDYTLDLIFKLQEFLGSEFRPIYKTSYRDSSAMATIFFKNIKEKILEEKKEKETNWNDEMKDSRKITKWAIKKINEIFPHIWSPSQIFDSTANTLLVKNGVGRLITERLFYLALKEKIFRYPQYNPFREYRRYEELNDLEGMLNYFEDILFRNIFELWKKDNRNWMIWSAWDINWHRFAESRHDLFIVNKKSKKVKCFLCDDKNGIFKVKDKNFCFKCYTRQICGTEFEKHKSKTIVTGELGYFPRYSYGEYYNGSNICNICKKKICYETSSEKVRVDVVEFMDEVYCKACFENNISKKLDESREFRKEYEELLSNKICKIYRVKHIN